MLGPPKLGPVVLQYSTPATHRRPGAVTTNGDGFRVPGPPVDTPAVGHTFPASGDLLRRFELQDVAGLYEVHANVELRAPARDGSTNADRWLVTIRGVARVFEVVRSAPWLDGPAGGDSWYVAALQEVDAS